MGEGWRQLSHHVRSQETQKGMHRCLVQTTLIMRSCGWQIHNHGQEHFLIDLLLLFRNSKAKKDMKTMKKLLLFV